MIRYKIVEYLDDQSSRVVQAVDALGPPVELPREVREAIYEKWPTADVFGVWLGWSISVRGYPVGFVDFEAAPDAPDVRQEALF